LMRSFAESTRRAGAALALLLLALGGCASTPQATPQRDAEAKQFISHPGTAAIYVYRPDFVTLEMDDSILYVGDRLIGSTLPGSFFRIDVQPGTHVVSSSAAGSTQLKLDTRPDELYFVELNVMGGNSRLVLVEPETAKRAIRKCCALMENWAPGQRPLLR
jgi:Protein of unknown function (DUF2846)